MQIKRMSLRMLACTLLLLGPSMARAADTKPGHGFVDEMARQGWSVSEPGVLKRDVGGRTETIGVGIEGFRAALAERQNLLGYYLQESALHPSKSLTQTITTLGEEIKQFRAYVAVLEQKGETANFEALTNAGCSLSLAYDATAAAQTAQQGVTAVASATITASCGLGNTYTSTYAYATQGTTTSSFSCSDAKYSGSSLSSSCSNLVAGGVSCGSQAYASVTVPPFGGVTAVTYSSSQNNTSCPPPPLGVTISSDVFYVELTGCQFLTWGATTTGGTAPTTIQSWTYDGATTSPGSSFTQYVCPPASGSQNHTLRVDARDSSSPQQTAFNQQTLTVVKITDPCALNPCSFACDPCACDPCCYYYRNGAEAKDKDPLKLQRFCPISPYPER